jgi:HEAT repeat protein
MATRLGALARKGLVVSETVMEVAHEADGKPLSKLLLSKALLDQAEDLDSAGLNDLTTDDYFSDMPVALASISDRRVICLEEEQDDDPAPAQSQTSLAINPDADTNAVIAKGEVRALLSSEDLSRLKMDLVTSAEPGKRLEALRKLYLSELGNDQKLRLFLAGLRDRNAEVRAEAARALGGLGLDSALTDNLARASAGSIAERVVSIGNLSQVLSRVEGDQASLALAMVVEFLETSEEKEVVLAAMGVLIQFLPDADSNSLAVRTHELLVKLLQVKFVIFEDVANRLYSKLYGNHRELVSSMLTELLGNISQLNIRYFALSLITEHDLESAAVPTVVERLVSGLCEGSELDRNYQACSAALTRLGERSIGQLLKHLKTATETGQRRLVDLIGHLLREGTESQFPLSDVSVKAATTALANLYVEATPEVCTAILESKFYLHPLMSDDSMAVAANGFVDSMHEFRFERQVELVQTALAKCGEPALNALSEALKESSHDVTRLTAANLVPAIVAEMTSITGAELVKLTDTLKELLDDEESDFPNRGPLQIALGRLSSHANYSSGVAGENSEYLRERLGTSSNVYDNLEAIGWLAAGENLDSNQRVECGYLLLSVLKKGLPGLSGRIRKNEEGEEVLHFGRETTAYTDMIPRILESIGRLLETDKTPDILFERISADLVQLWKDITDYKLIWAPAAVMSLARLLGDIARSDRTEMATVEDIAELLSRKLILLPVLQVISSLAVRELDSERLRKLAFKVFNELHKRLSEEPAPDVVERRQIITTMTGIAKRGSIGERDKDIEHARKVTIESLFDALRDKVFAARGLLSELSEHDGLSEKQRTEIKRRLKPAGNKA